MEKVTLRNDYHATEVTVVKPQDGILSKSVSVRVRRELCGIDGCTCGAIRGVQSVRVVEDNDGCYQIDAN